MADGDEQQKRTPDDPERIARLCQAMRLAGLDAVAATTPSEVLLLTGYWPIFGTSMALLTADGSLHAIVPEDELELAQRTTTAELTPYKPELLDRLTGPVEQIRQHITRELAELHLAKGKIGLPLGLNEQPATYAVTVHFRGSFRDLLQELAPEAVLVGCDDLLEAEKAVKTARELDRMRTACRIAEAGFQVAAEAIQPGLREAEVAAAIQYAFDRTPLAEAALRSYGFFFCMSGPHSATAAAAFARTRQRQIEPGDLVMIHANTCADGLWTDITRTYTAGGDATDRQKAMRTAIGDARAAALGAIRPGVPARAVDQAARQVMQAHGFGDAVFQHATGHGVGYAAANANALPRIHPASPDVLEAGMTFNVEPAAYFQGYGGMRHCDMVAVTKTGVEVLTGC